LWLRIRIDYGRLVPDQGIGNADPDLGGQKLPTKIEKSEEISGFEVPGTGYSLLLRAWSSFMEA
jgi:hypothetical protein